MASPKATGAISSSLSKGNSRRTTCDTCRERKVRCNKEHPACERCTRLKLKCEYTPQSESLDVSQALLQLHSRLEQAEAELAARSATATVQSKINSHEPSSTSLAGWDTSNDTLLDPNLSIQQRDDGLLFENYGGWGMCSQVFSQPTTENMEGIQIQNMIPFPPWTVSQPHQPSSLTSQHSTGTSGCFGMSSPPVDMISISQNVMPLLHHRYFQATQSMPTIINQNRFSQLLAENPTRHQVAALKNAVAMAGAALSEDFPHLETLFYQSSRDYIDKAERQEDGSSFQNLEILQALLLIIRHEFTETTSTAAAWMTHGRAMRLVKLICFDVMDAKDPSREEGGLRIPLSSSVSKLEMDERRRTFWIAFNVDFFVSALTNAMPTFQLSKISTYLPSGNLSDDSPAAIFLKDVIGNPKFNINSVFSPLVIATGIGNRALQHLKLSSNQECMGPGFVYDFWTHHFELDRTTLEYLSLFPLSRADAAGSDITMLTITHLTLLGVTILIHQRAYERAILMGSSGNLSSDSRHRYEEVASEISEAVQHGIDFSRENLNICNHLGMYLLWPVSLAARVQMMRLKSPSPSAETNIPPQLQSQQLNSTYNSLKVLDTTLKKLSVDNSMFKDLIEDIRVVLDSCSNSIMITQELGRQRTLSSSIHPGSGFYF